MTARVYDITQRLTDSLALGDAADRAGITMQQARAFCASLADLPIRQAIRICVTAQLHRIMQSQRAAR